MFPLRYAPKGIIAVGNVIRLSTSVYWPVGNLHAFTIPLGH